MAWTTPRTWATSEMVTAALLNEQLRDNLVDLDDRFTDYVMVVDKKSSGNNGGAFTSGAWRTRTLNTILSDANSLLSLDSNQLTLAAGTYQCFITAPAVSVNTHQARLYNVTDSSLILTGTNSRAEGSHSFIAGLFTIAADKAVEVQHRCESTNATNGFGIYGNWGDEYYTVAQFWRIG